ncbi:GNAT family N-acetyltransferase [Janibacter sp. GS2]|uniref:GNAT family N-acetyltransferase n=1 Tax=Janibacter sp. GS2 TaxID=3442646 RepID=UPI003EBE46DB
MIRPRREEDLPALGEVLLEQQVTSGYPYRNPLPFPPRDFIVRPGETSAWVAEVDGVPVGHIALSRPRSPSDVSADQAVIIRAWQDAHGRPHTELGEVCVFFVASTVRGRRVGAALLDTAVDDLTGRGLAPCLDVVPTHAAALRLYRRRGWLEVGRGRPDWLDDDAPDVLAMVLPEPDRQP